MRPTTAAPSPDVAARVEDRGEDVAAPAAAHEDLLPAVARSFEEQNLGPAAAGGAGNAARGARREDGGHESGGAGADPDDRIVRPGAGGHP